MADVDGMPWPSLDMFSEITLVNWGYLFTKLDFVNNRYMVRGRNQRLEHVCTIPDQRSTRGLKGGSAVNPDSGHYETVGLKNRIDVPYPKKPGALNEACRLDYTIIVDFEYIPPPAESQPTPNYDTPPPGSLSDTDVHAISKIPQSEHGAYLSLLTAYQQRGVGDSAVDYYNFDVQFATEYKEFPITWTFDKVDYDRWVPVTMINTETGMSTQGPVTRGSGPTNYICPCLGANSGITGLPGPAWAVAEHQAKAAEMFALRFSFDWFFLDSTGAEPAEPPPCRSTLWVADPFQRFLGGDWYVASWAPFRLDDGNENWFMNHTDGFQPPFYFFERQYEYHYIGPAKYGYHVPMPHTEDESGHVFVNFNFPEKKPAPYGLIGGDQYFFTGAPWSEPPYGPTSRDPYTWQYHIERGTDYLVPMTYSYIKEKDPDVQYGSFDEYVDLRLFNDAKEEHGSAGVVPGGSAEGNGTDHFYPDWGPIFTGGGKIDKAAKGSGQGKINRVAITVREKYMAYSVNGGPIQVIRQDANFSIPRGFNAREQAEDGKFYSFRKPRPYLTDADGNSTTGEGFAFEFLEDDVYVRCIWIHPIKQPKDAETLPHPLTKWSKVRDLPLPTTTAWKRKY